MFKKILITGFVLLLLSTIGLLIAVRLFITGAVGFDDWVMRQVLGVAQTYIVPSIEFDDFAYEAPGTVRYQGVRLRSPDGVEIINAGELVVTLGEVPKRGKPIVIEGITIRDGDLRLIADHDDPDVTFKGLAPFVKKANYKRQEQLAKEVRLSETLDLRSIALDNAGIIYEPGNGQPAMQLDALTMVMNIEPVESDGGVWHTLGIDIDRGDLFSLVVDGRVNLDELAIDLQNLDMQVDVGSESVAALPPQLQQLMIDHEAKGSLGVKLSGAGQFADWQASTAQGAITISDFNFGIGEYRIPMEQGRIPIKLSDGSALVGPTQIESLGGTLSGLISADLRQQALPADLEWSVQGFHLRELLRTASPDGEPPRIAGILETFGSASASLTDLPGSIDGLGEVHITQGRLVNLPGVRAINELLHVVTPRARNGSLSDKFDAEFTLTEQGIQVDSSQLETRALLARGKGLITYQMDLDLNINAGPMEKLQSLLGKVGKVIGEITDQLVTYHVTGKINAPKVKVKPLGVGR